MKRLITLLSIAAAVSSMTAAEYITAGNGTNWNFATLAQVGESGVTVGDAPGTYVLDGSVTIAAGDSFTLDDGITVLMAKNAELVIDGTASFDVANGSTFTRQGEGVVPHYVFNRSQEGDIVFHNVHFEYAGLKQFSDYGITVDHCTFRYHEANTTNGSGAISIGGTGSVNVTNSTFEYNKRSGISGAANSSCNVTIEGCRFYYNDQQNLNYPQINLTAAENVLIRCNQVIGDRTKTRGGGIVVSNLQGAAKNGHCWIENNYVADNRFGISVYSDQTAYVLNNYLLNNNTETNPNNGGSGINITDASGTQTTFITGNHIEGHFWGVSIIGGKDINLGRIDVPMSDPAHNPGMNTFIDNGVDEVPYELYNNSTNTVYAQNNYWRSATNLDELASLITDKSDNDTLGEVLYLPAAGGIGVSGSKFDLNDDNNVNVGDVSRLYQEILGTGNGE